MSRFRLSASMCPAALLGLILFLGCSEPKTELIENIPPMTTEELAAEETTSESSE